jgi:hypothetical protein
MIFPSELLGAADAIGGFILEAQADWYDSKVSTAKAR